MMAILIASLAALTSKSGPEVGLILDRQSVAHAAEWAAKYHTIEIPVHHDGERISDPSGSPIDARYWSKFRDQKQEVRIYLWAQKASPTADLRFSEKDLPKNVLVILGGNWSRPSSELPLEFDASEANLPRNYTPRATTQVVDYRHEFQWIGVGLPSRIDDDHLTELANRVHRSGYKLRVRYAPSQAAVFDRLLTGGADVVMSTQSEFLERYNLPKTRDRS